ncbi:MAG: MFS transporter [Patescibacteria group bacterium]|uniref:MFS transporter n=1 Tax=candidate division WWE3 bacterium TaxID=2053526 RepID=A0A955ECN9_UNCKA|nr:MFS transporter [candidate division WWE3 bacterium]
MFKKIFPIIALSFVNMLGFLILVPVLPFVIRELGYSDYYYGILLSIYPAAQFLAAPILGSLSDKYGRKPLLLVSQAGTAFSWVIFGISYYFYINGNFSYTLFFIALSRLFDGLTGGNISIANAYLSDITTKDEKSYAFGLNGASMGLALIVGPTLGSISSAGSLGYLGTAILALIISIITLGLIFKLSESLSEVDRRGDFENRLLKQLNIITRVVQFKNNKTIMDMFFIRFIFSFIMSTYSTLITLFIIDRFNFDKHKLGLYMLIVGVYLVFNQLVMVKKFVSKYGDYKTLFIGTLFMGIGFIMLTQLYNIVAYTLFYYIVNLGISLVFPTEKSILSNASDPKIQGEVMGVDEALGSLASIPAPVLGGLGYALLGPNSLLIVAFITLLFTVKLYPYLKKSSL